MVAQSFCQVLRDVASPVSRLSEHGNHCHGIVLLE
jgi:hypothetical protein